MNFEPLGSLADIQIGRTPKRAVREYWGVGEPWVSIADLKGHTIKRTKEQITFRGIKESGIKRISKGTLLLSFKLSIGKLAFAGMDLYTNEAICALVIRDRKKLHAPYLYYALRAMEFKGSNQAAMGSTLNTASLNALKIPIPGDFTDQFKIAKVLSDAEELISMRVESLALIDEYLRSCFFSTFGDPAQPNVNMATKKLADIVKPGTGGTPSRKFESLYYKGEINWAKTTEVSGDYISSTQETITEQGLKNSNCRVYPVGTILIAMYGQGKTRGSVGYLDIEAATNQACAAIVPSENIDQTFLFYALKYSYDKIRSLGRGGNQENLNLDIVGNLDIISPDPMLQKEFGLLEQKVRLLRHKMTESLRELRSLYQNLSQGAFTEQLDLSKLTVTHELSYSATDNDRTEPKEIDWDSVSVSKRQVSPLIPRHEVEPLKTSPAVQRRFDWELFLRRHFPDQPIETEKVQNLFMRENYERGLEFSFQDFTDMVFNELKKEKSFLRQVFDKERRKLNLYVRL